MLSLALLLLVVGGGQAQAYAESPTDAIKRTNRRINQLLSRKAPAGAAADKLKDQIKQEVSSFLDFTELARLALSRHWEARTEAQRKEFVQILQDLIERNYIKQLRANMGYTIQYGKESRDGETASVATTVKVVNSKRTTELTIEYKMRRVGKRWMVYDVVTDDVSIVRNYRSQFNRIIRRESYEALVKKMREKLL